MWSPKATVSDAVMRKRQPAGYFSYQEPNPPVPVTHPLLRIPRHYFEGYFSDMEDYLLGKRHKRVSCRKGEQPFFNGHSLKNLYFYILSGAATVHGYTEQGDRKEMCCYASGVFGLLGIDDNLDSIYHNELMRALTDMEILLFERETVLDMLQENHRFVLRILAFHNDMIALLSYHSLMLAYLPSEVRLCDYLYMCYLYYPSSKTLHPEVLCVYQEQIASYIGVTRTQVTRLLRSLKESGLIQTSRGHIILTDPERLLQRCSKVINCR